MVASSVPPGTDGPASHALLKLGKFFTRWEESPDGRAVYREGGPVTRSTGTGGATTRWSAPRTG